MGVCCCYHLAEFSEIARRELERAKGSTCPGEDPALGSSRWCQRSPSTPGSTRPLLPLLYPWCYLLLGVLLIVVVSLPLGIYCRYCYTIGCTTVYYRTREGSSRVSMITYLLEVPAWMPNQPVHLPVYSPYHPLPTLTTTYRATGVHTHTLLGQPQLSSCPCRIHLTP